MKNEVTVVQDFETWKKEDFTANLVSAKPPPRGLDAAGRIKYYHSLSMETSMYSIAAALMAALELHRVKCERSGDFQAWCEANLPFGKTTVYRYLNVLEKSFGNKGLIYDLAHDTEQNQLAAVAKFTRYTNYRSLYQLYHGEGIVKKSNLGGAGRGQGRKRKVDAEELAKAADGISQGLNRDVILDAVSQLYVLTVTNDGFGDLDTATLRNEVEMLEKMTARAKDILRSRRGRD